MKISKLEEIIYTEKEEKEIEAIIKKNLFNRDELTELLKPYESPDGSYSIYIRSTMEMYMQSKFKELSKEQQEQYLRDGTLIDNGKINEI